MFIFANCSYGKVSSVVLIWTVWQMSDTIWLKSWQMIPSIPFCCQWSWPYSEFLQIWFVLPFVIISLNCVANVIGTSTARLFIGWTNVEGLLIFGVKWSFFKRLCATFSLRAESFWSSGLQYNWERLCQICLESKPKLQSFLWFILGIGS